MTTANHFERSATDGMARTGLLATPHGVVRTPAFMPVGTAGAMKGVHWREVREAGADIVLGNTYHLMLRPGAERIAALGGLQTFTGWNGPMLTDSGGFQVMSLAQLRKVSESAVTFRSHIDGLSVELSPERSIEVQRLGRSAIALPLDESGRAPQSVMLAMIEEVAPILPEGRPRYLMGVGTPEDMLEAVARGIDMFDCVMPTRNGRHGVAYTRFGQINLRNARHADDPRPLDEESTWPSTRDCARAYLHHLVKSGETLGAMLLSEINIAYYQRLMQDIREAVSTGTFASFRDRTRTNWA